MDITLKEVIDYGLISKLERNFFSVDEQDIIIEMRNYQNPVRYEIRI